MRFIVELFRASLFIDKTDSKISFIHRHNFYLLHICLEFAPRNIVVPYPSYRSHEPLINSYWNTRSTSPNRRIHIGFRDNHVQTDDFNHIEVSLYLWEITLTCSHREIEHLSYEEKPRSLNNFRICTTGL